MTKCMYTHTHTQHANKVNSWYITYTRVCEINSRFSNLEDNTLDKHISCLLNDNLLRLYLHFFEYTLFFD